MKDNLEDKAYLIIVQMKRKIEQSKTNDNHDVTCSGLVRMAADDG